MSLSLHIFSIGLMHFCWTCRDLKDPTMYWEPKKKQNTSLSQLHTRNITYEKLQSCFFCPKKLISQAQRKASEGSSYTVYHQQPSPSMILARTFRSTLVIDWTYVCEAVLPAYLIAFRVLWLLAERPKARVVGVRGWLGGWLARWLGG